MRFKTCVYLWAKPGEERVYVSACQPDRDNVDRLKKKGYRFFRLPVALPDEFEIADQELATDPEVVF